MTPLVAAHALGASLALLLGAWQLVHRPRGDRAHRRVGRVWVVAMYWTVLSSFFITELDPGHFSWIHGLSALTFVTLTIGTWAAVLGRVGLHRQFMTGSYLGLLGAFTAAVAVPARDVPQLLVHRPVVFAAAVAGVAVAGATVVALCRSGGRPVERTAGPAVDAGRVAEA
jgi:uncharacterized membrane protein